MSEFVYAVEGAGLVKIGRSFAPELRLRTMQGHSPVALTMLGYIDGDHTVERDLHERFREYRVHGEWFRKDGEVSAWIESALADWVPFDSSNGKKNIGEAA